MLLFFLLDFVMLNRIGTLLKLRVSKIGFCLSKSDIDLVLALNHLYFCLHKVFYDSN